MSHKTYAVIYGVLFLLLGLLGFVPFLTPDSHLFGFIRVNVLHNIIYLMIGVLGILAAFKNVYSRWYFKIAGFTLIFLALLGLMFGSHLLLMPLSIGGNLFNLVMGAFAIYLGFGKERV